MLLSLTIILGCPAGCASETPPGDPGRVVRMLVDLLEDPNAQVRRSAARALGKLGRVEAAGPLVEALGDADPVVRAYGAAALGNLGAAAMDQAGIPLARRLSDPSDSVKDAAARALGRMGATPAVVELVVEALRHPDPETRRAAAQALSGLEAESAYGPLTNALHDEDRLVRQHAVSALGELADRRAVPLIHERLTSDPALNVRSEAAYRLGKLGTGAHLPALRAAAEHDPALMVRWWAEWAAEQVTSVGEFD